MIVKEIIELLYPPRCIGCKKENIYPICSACSDDIELVEEPLCLRCGSPEVSYRPPGTHGGICRDCRRQPPIFTNAHSGFLYRGVMKKFIHHVKYHRKQEVARFFGAQLLLVTQAWLRQLPRLHAVIPVPTTQVTKRYRGFNQSEILARVVADHLNIQCEVNVLERLHRAFPQHQLTREERFKYIQGVYGVKLESAAATTQKYDRLLLVDDIYTTGATISACTAALRAAGHGREGIYVLTLCRVWNQTPASMYNAPRERTCKSLSAVMEPMLPQP